MIISSIILAAAMACPCETTPRCAAPDAESARMAWVETMLKIAGPVLESLADGTLDAKLPHRPVAWTDWASRLEATGRVCCGVLPWFELPDDDTPEGVLRAKWRAIAQRAVARAVDPASRRFLPWGGKGQPLVDAAFFAQGLHNAPRFRESLPPEVKSNIVARLKETRATKPYESNWLLFASQVEALLLEMTGECDEARLTYGVERFIGDKSTWYVGSGLYSDGDKFALDYYNSFVIQPMLFDVLSAMTASGRFPEAAALLEKERKRYRRYAEVQERLIGPDGTYPLTGRSICYRFGAFHHLAKSAVIGGDCLPAKPGAIRAALSAVIARQSGPQNFDADGWLTVGFNGTQEMLAERYISRGSPYLCCFVFVPLALPPSHPFWSDPASDWTQRAAWSGRPVAIDHD